MPELPEVEAIARALRDGGRGAPSVLDRVIEEVQFDDPGIIEGSAATVAARRLRGARIEAVRRRAKYLLIGTSAGTLVAHLRMTGDLEVDDDVAEQLPYQRLRLALSGDLSLRFTDPRRLGKLWLTDDAASVMGDLGPEPFDPALTAPLLRERLAATTRTLKGALLDQRLLAGLGNIWADEALHRARLHPEQPADSLDEEEAGRLLDGIRGALEAGIEETTTELRWIHRAVPAAERDTEPPGRVHLREGAPCPTCGAAIERVRLAGRSTYFCPRCQAPTARGSRRRAGARPRRAR